MSDDAGIAPGSLPRWLVLLVAAAFFLIPSNWAASDGWVAGDTFSTTLDAWLTYPTAVSMVHDGDAELSEFGPAVDHYTLKETDDGRLEFRQSWITAVPLVPAVLLLDAAEVVGVGDGSEALVPGRRWGPLQAATAAALALASIFVVWRIAAHAGLDRHTAIGLVILWSLGSMVWTVASKALWQHTVLLLPGLLLAERLLALERDGTASRRAAGWIGALSALLVLTRPAVLPMVAVLALFVVIRSRPAAIWAAVTGAVVTGVGVVVTGVLYDWSLPAYLDQNSRVGWHDDSVIAFASLVASASRSAVLFAPVLLLAAYGAWSARARRFDLVAAATAAVTIQLFFTTALWDGWDGGFSYGPRFVVDVLPVALIPTIAGIHAIHDPQRRSTVLSGLAALGIFVNLPGGVTHQAGCWNAQYETPEELADAAYDWGDSQFGYGYRNLVRGGVDAYLGPCD